MKGYFIDNYGFYYMIQADISPLRSAYPDKLVKIDVMKPVNGNQYVYPLSDALIDIVKTIPIVVGTPHTNDTNYVELESLINVLPSIRQTASLFYHQTVGMDTLQKENEMLKEQLRMKAVLEAENEALKTRVATLEAKQKEIEANHAFAPVHFNVL
jgi:hypothetical protein